MVIKFEAGVSTGVEFTLNETRTVVVTVEAIEPTVGYHGDELTYTATVLDNTDAKLPATFVASLKFGATEVFSGALAEAVYDQETGLLTLPFDAPDIAAGEIHIELSWAEQEI